LTNSHFSTLSGSPLEKGFEEEIKIIGESPEKHEKCEDDRSLGI
jgi:hypothetical protein